MDPASTIELQDLLEDLCRSNNSGDAQSSQQKEALADCKPGVHDALFWQRLQDGLAFGSTQQRKLCLAIARITIEHLLEDVSCERFHFRVNNKELTLSRFEKFHSLYITIVINHYVNQVEDCLDELSIFLQPDCGIDPIWILSLFSAAIEKSMQDSIRKIIGMFLLEEGHRAYASTSTGLLDHLTCRVLPWVGLGSLYSSSISNEETGSDTRSMPAVCTEMSLLKCTHGDRSSAYLQLLISTHSERSMRPQIIKCILKYLVENSTRLYSFSRAYLIEGVQRGLSEDQGISLDDECADLIINLSSQTGFHEVAGHAMHLMLRTLADRVKSPRDPSLNRVIHQAASLEVKPEAPSLREYARNLQGKADDAGAVEQPPSIKQLLLWIASSRHKCLDGEGLLAGCKYMRAAIDRSDQNLDAADLQVCVEALWQGIEVQDRPRYPLMAFPSLIFHHNLLSCITSSPSLLKTITDIVLQLQVLCDHRVYLFSSFAFHLRSAVLYVPAASTLPLSQIIVHFAKVPPRTEVEFVLESIFARKIQDVIPWRTYEHYYGKGEGYGYAAFLDMLNAVPHTSSFRKHYRIALDSLLQPWMGQKGQVPVFSSWKNTTQLQVILILSELCISPSLAKPDAGEVDVYLATYWHLLKLEPLPRFRYLLEWIITRIYIRTERREEVLEPLDDLDLSNPKFAVSQMKLALSIACLHDTREQFNVDLMNMLMVLAASPKITVRHEAQWSIPVLWDACKNRDSCLGIFENPAVCRMNSWIRTLEAYKVPPAGRLLESRDHARDHSLSNLTEGNYLSIEPREASRCRRGDFLEVFQDDSRASDLIKSGGQGGLVPLGSVERKPAVVSPTSAPGEGPGQATLTSSAPDLNPGTSIPLQMKASAWSSELESLLGTNTASKRQVRPVTVVASLIDNAFNVGGLSRVSEIFGCEALMVRTLKIIKSKDFTQVSVSSDQHLPLQELAPGPETEYQPLVDFIREKRKDGYQVVAIEQTDSSRILGAGSTVWPKKVVLLLGSEKEGVPARLLREVNWCVEVKQTGVTRSMNVQTAAAVVLYDISRQLAVRREG